MTSIIILDLNDLINLLDGKEVKCKLNDRNIAFSLENTVADDISRVFKSIGTIDSGHRVIVDGREYVDRIVFQNHLEEQVMECIRREKNES